MQALTTGGSISEVGWRFQPFRINDLEMVAQIFPRWNPLTSWIRQIVRLPESRVRRFAKRTEITQWA
jgi:hypothetical protein